MAPARNVHARDSVVARREEGATAERVVRGACHARHHALAEAQALEQLVARFGVEHRGLGFELHADRERVVDARFAKLLGESFRFGETVFADVHDDEHPLVGEQEHRREQRALLGREAGAVDRDAVAEHHQRALERGDLPEERLVALGGAALTIEAPLHRREVGEHELELEGLEVAAGIGVARHRRIVEGAEHVEDGVAVTQRAEEPVPEALAGARALDQRGDVDDLEAGVHELLGVRHLAEPVDPLVGHVGDPDRGLGGGERVRGDDRVGAGERVEQTRLAAVRKADEAETLHGRPRVPAVPVSGQVAERIPATGGRPLASATYEQEDEQAQTEVTAQQGQPRQEAERRPQVTPPLAHGVGSKE